MCCIADLEVGQEGIIKEQNIEGTQGRRLREMGLIEGTSVKLQRRAPTGYPIMISVFGSSLTLDEKQAHLIEVQ